MGRLCAGTISSGQTEGVRLLAAYLSGEGWVMLQVEIPGATDGDPSRAAGAEVSRFAGQGSDGGRAAGATALVAPGCAGRWGLRVDGERQSERVQADIELLFDPESCVAGFSPVPKDFGTASTVEKGTAASNNARSRPAVCSKGTWIRHTLSKSSSVERRCTRLKDGKVTQQVVHGVTSLTAQEASSQRLLELVRLHWQIENGLHYRRDETSARRPLSPAHRPCRTSDGHDQRSGARLAPAQGHQERAPTTTTIRCPSASGSGPAPTQPTLTLQQPWRLGCSH